jgi:hypothetical protein
MCLEQGEKVREEQDIKLSKEATKCAVLVLKILSVILNDMDATKISGAEECMFELVCFPTSVWK